MAPHPSPPAGQVCLITGGGSGIGRGIALALAEAGHRVIVAGRTAATLAATARLAGPRAEIEVGDVSAPGRAAAMVRAIVDRHGRLDLLVNNAGITGPAHPIESYPEAAWREVIDVNVTGAFLCAQAAFAVMRGQRPAGGRIVTIGSVSAHVPRPHAVAYTTSKHALTGLTRALSLEGRNHRIACGQIDIGNAATPMTAGLAAGALQADGSRRAEPTIDVAAIAAAVLQMTALPVSVSVPFTTIMATAMPYAGRG